MDPLEALPMKRPPNDEAISLRMPLQLKQTLDQAAMAADLSRSAYIVRVLKQHFATQPQPKPQSPMEKFLGWLNK